MGWEATVRVLKKISITSVIVFSEVPQKACMEEDWGFKNMSTTVVT
jgi:hypothetical protein